MQSGVCCSRAYAFVIMLMAPLLLCIACNICMLEDMNMSMKGVMPCILHAPQVSKNHLETGR